MYALPCFQLGTVVLSHVDSGGIKMLVLNELITYSYYVITALFGIAICWNAYKTQNAQESILYIIVLIPFVLRLLHIK